MRWFILSLLIGCGGSQHVITQDAERTCLVLSVGAAKGVAHIGAIEAVRDAGVEVDCIVGNSMGALVGALHASAPTENINDRFLHLLDAYKREGHRELGRRSASGGLLGLLFAPFTGGASLVAAGAGALAGAASTRRMDHRRMVQVLDRELGQARIEDLPIEYMTAHLVAANTGVRLVVSREGNLAQAVGASVHNPLIFRELDVRRTHQIDPGVDRVSATPVQDACNQFPGARLIAINVTGQPAFYSGEMDCPLLEVRVETGEINVQQVLGNPGGEEYARVVQAGYFATCEALGSDCDRPARSLMAEP